MGTRKRSREEGDGHGWGYWRSAGRITGEGRLAGQGLMSARGRRKIQENLRRVSQHSGASRRWARGEGPGSRRRGIRGGRRRRAAEQATRPSGAPILRRKREKRGKERQGREDVGKEGKKGMKATRRATATSRKKVKGKRLSRSLRTHPQPESTTLSVL